MEIKIDYDKHIANYFELIEDIKACNNVNTLTALLQDLSAHLKAKDIDSFEAKLLLEVANTQINIIHNSKGLDKDKTMGGMRPTTAVSSRTGIASVIFLIANLAILAVMFTMLVIAKVVR